jgi:Sec-independent protein secretion pathway component TatC
MMMVPLVLLYELSIILSAGIARGRNKRELEQDVESALQPPEGTVGAGR